MNAIRPDDYLFDPSSDPDPAIAELETKLRPLTEHPPALGSLPPKTAAKVEIRTHRSEPETISMHPAIPASNSTVTRARRGLVLGALAVAAVSTLATLWALKVPSERPPSDVGPVASTAALGPSTTPTAFRDRITLVPPGGSDFDLVELSIMPLDGDAVQTYAPLARPDGSLPLDLAGHFALSAAAQRSERGHYVAKARNVRDALTFEASLGEGRYVACGLLTDASTTAAAGCQVVDVGASGGLTPAFVRLEAVDGEAADASNSSSPDLKDPFGPTSGADDDDPAPKDPFGGAGPEGRGKKAKKGQTGSTKRSSPDLKDPFGGSRKQPGEAPVPAVLDPWSGN